MTRIERIKSLKQELIDYKPQGLSQEDIEDVSSAYQAHLEYNEFIDGINWEIERLDNMTDSEWEEEEELSNIKDDEEEAKHIDPSGQNFNGSYSGWVDPNSVKCTEIGEANENQEKGVILASFNAG